MKYLAEFDNGFLSSLGMASNKAVRELMGSLPVYWHFGEWLPLNLTRLEDAGESGVYVRACLGFFDTLLSSADYPRFIECPRCGADVEYEPTDADFVRFSQTAGGEVIDGIKGHFHCASCANDSIFLFENGIWSTHAEELAEEEA